MVTCLENKMHGFETDDTVTFKEVLGMTQINNMQCKIKGMHFCEISLHIIITY